MGYPSYDLTFEQLQKEHKEWVERNFPDAQPYYSLLGLSEEVGELNHAHLKGLQGIRHTPEEIQAMKEDAVGDIVVYLADYCTKNGIDFQDAVEKTWQQVLARDWQKNKKDGKV
jgi:NTP pyrophosphatase (non-canonical NTP hydrolase)